MSQVSLSFKLDNNYQRETMLQMVKSMEELLKIKIAISEKEEEKKHEPDDSIVKVVPEIVTLPMINICREQELRYSIPTTNEDRIRVCKKDFVHWCYLVLQKYRSDLSIRSKVIILLKFGAKRLHLERMLDIDSEAMTALQHGELYPYLVNSWNMYFRSGVTYLSDGSSRTEADRKEADEFAKLRELMHDVPQTPASEESSAPIEEVVITSDHPLYLGGPCLGSYTNVAFMDATTVKKIREICKKNNVVDRLEIIPTILRYGATLAGLSKLTHIRSGKFAELLKSDYNIYTNPEFTILLSFSPLIPIPKYSVLYTDNPEIARERVMSILKGMKTPEERLNYLAHHYNNPYYMDVTWFQKIVPALMRDYATEHPEEDIGTLVRQMNQKFKISLPMISRLADADYECIRKVAMTMNDAFCMSVSNKYYKRLAVLFGRKYDDDLFNSVPSRFIRNLDAYNNLDIREQSLLLFRSGYTTSFTNKKSEEFMEKYYSEWFKRAFEGKEFTTLTELRTYIRSIATPITHFIRRAKLRYTEVKDMLESATVIDEATRVRIENTFHCKLNFEGKLLQTSDHVETFLKGTIKERATFLWHVADKTCETLQIEQFRKDLIREFFTNNSFSSIDSFFRNLNENSIPWNRISSYLDSDAETLVAIKKGADHETVKQFCKQLKQQYNCKIVPKYKTSCKKGKEAIYTTIADFVKEYCAKNKIKKSELAVKIGCSYPYLRALIAGSNKVSSNMCSKLHDLFGITIVM